MKILFISVLAAGTLGLSLAQIAPPAAAPPNAGTTQGASSTVNGSTAQIAPPSAPPDARMMQGASTTVSGSISRLNYGPEGNVDGFVLSNNTLIHLPREWSATTSDMPYIGDQISGTGFQTTSASGMKIVEPQSLKIGSKTFTRNQPGQFQQFNGSGVIKQLNYGGRGEVNGFLLENGTLARTAPFNVLPAQIKPGTKVTLSGTVRQTVTGINVVNVQSLTANGQTIPMAAPAPPRGQPGRRARLIPPPPPPAPGGPAAAPPAPAQ